MDFCKKRLNWDYSDQCLVSNKLYLMLVIHQTDIISRYLDQMYQCFCVDVISVKFSSELLGFESGDGPSERRPAPPAEGGRARHRRGNQETRGRRVTQHQEQHRDREQ